MTKAKTKSRRVWLLLGAYGDMVRAFNHREIAISFRLEGMKVIPATLTWTPPAKAKKRSAKR
jgi:hypothetical protein